MQWTTANTLTLVGIAIGFILQTLAIVASVAYGWGKFSTLLSVLNSTVEKIWLTITEGISSSHAVDKRVSVVESRVDALEENIERRATPRRDEER